MMTFLMHDIWTHRMEQDILHQEVKDLWHICDVLDLLKPPASSQFSPHSLIVRGSSRSTNGTPPPIRPTLSACGWVLPSVPLFLAYLSQAGNVCQSGRMQVGGGYVGGVPSASLFLPHLCGRTPSDWMRWGHDNQMGGKWKDTCPPNLAYICCL